MTQCATAMTLRDVIAIFRDLDAYIAKGGTLLDLPIFGEIPEPQRSILRDSVGPEMAERWRRYVKKIADLSEKRGSSQDLIGKNVTEDDARRIWRETK